MTSVQLFNNLQPFFETVWVKIWRGHTCASAWSAPLQRVCFIQRAAEPRHIVAGVRFNWSREARISQNIWGSLQILCWTCQNGWEPLGYNTTSIQTGPQDTEKACGGRDLIPVVVEPGSIAGYNDVMGLFSHVVLRVNQTIDLRFALFIFLLSITIHKHFQNHLTLYKWLGTKVIYW